MPTSLEKRIKMAATRVSNFKPPVELTHELTPVSVPQLKKTSSTVRDVRTSYEKQQEGKFIFTLRTISGQQNMAYST